MSIFSEPEAWPHSTEKGFESYNQKEWGERQWKPPQIKQYPHQNHLDGEILARF